MLDAVPDADDAAIGDLFVAVEFGLELGRGDLEALCKTVLAHGKRLGRGVGLRTVLDELLYAIGDVKVALVVDLADVACLEPPVLVEGLLLQIRPVPVSVEYVWPLNQQLSSLPPRQFPALTLSQ